MKVNISRKKSGLKYAPKLNKGWAFIEVFAWIYDKHSKGFYPKYRKLSPIKLNDRLFF